MKRCLISLAVIALLTTHTISAGEISGYMAAGIGAEDIFSGGVGLGVGTTISSPLAVVSSIYLGIRGVAHFGTSSDIEIGSDLELTTISSKVSYLALEWAPILVHSGDFRFMVIGLVGAARTEVDVPIAVGTKDSEIELVDETKLLLSPGLGVTFDYGPMWFGAEGRYMVIDGNNSAAAYGRIGLRF